LLPKIQVSGTAEYEYPNQSELKTVQQNIAMVSASMPLFDWGREWKQAAAARAQADAAEARKTQAQADLIRDTQKARDQYAALKDEGELDSESAKEANDFAKLVRDSYRAGRSTYLEVESADLKALEAQVSYARTSVQVLLQAAILRSLTMDETKD
jgi:outer membrane protein TolC